MDRRSTDTAREAQMQSQDILQMVSGAAVALAGFSGVVAVLGRRVSGDWTSQELLQLRTLVEPSLIALFGSFIPGIVQLVSPSESLTWRLSNGVLGLLGVAGVAAFISRSLSTRTTIGQRVLLTAAVTSVGAQLLAAAGVLTQYELIFVFGLVLALVVAAHNFLLLLFSTGRAS
jgi:hypothetical protein